MAGNAGPVCAPVVMQHFRIIPQEPSLPLEAFVEYIPTFLGSLLVALFEERESSWSRTAGTVG